MQDQVPCPHCGADIAADAHFCRHCGSSDADGWKEDWENEDEDDFDYQQFVQDNFSAQVTNTATPVIWRLTAVVLLVASAMILYKIAAGLF